MARHFWIEEELLLPAFASSRDAGDEAVVRVLVDHVWMRGCMERLAASELSLDAVHELGECLEAHVRHEEQWCSR
jgi:hypothetical protein